jgi:hypothetical protein
MNYSRQTVFAGTTFPTGWAYTDATFEVACPRCGAPAGYYCAQPMGRQAPTPHVERLTAYRDKIGAAEWTRRHTRHSLPRD